MDINTKTSFLIDQVKALSKYQREEHLVESMIQICAKAVVNITQTAYKTQSPESKITHYSGIGLFRGDEIKDLPGSL